MPLQKKLLPGASPASQQYHASRPSAGYMLIELVAVLALLAVLAALAVPRFNALPQWRLDAAARQLVSDLRLLRQEAINNGSQCKVEFYIYLNRYTLTTPQERRHIYLPEAVSFEGNTTFSGLPPTLSFNYLGRPGSGGTVTLKNGDARRFIIVTPVTGRVRLSRDPPQNW